MPIEESIDQVDAGVVVKLRSAVGATMDDFQLSRQPKQFVPAVQFVRLIDRDLRVLVSVNHQQRRIVSIDMEYGTGQLCQRRVLFGLRPQQKLQRGNTDAESVRR